MLESFNLAEQLGKFMVRVADLIKVTSLLYVYHNVLAVVTNKLVQ